MKKWKLIKKLAEEWLYTRVRYIVDSVSDNPDDIYEFLDVDGLYVSGSTVAYAVALARGTVTATKNLPKDMDVYAKNPLTVAATKIGKVGGRRRLIYLVPIVFNDIADVMKQFDGIMVQCAYDIKRQIG